ncbi:MAG: hypothetical protein ACE14L_04860 [Terriglobales bacterium]
MYVLTEKSRGMGDVATAANTAAAVTGLSPLTLGLIVIGGVFLFGVLAQPPIARAKRKLKERVHAGVETWKVVLIAAAAAGGGYALASYAQTRFA